MDYSEKSEKILRNSRFGPKGDIRRQALIEAGYRVVFAHGLGALTFRAIAAQAQVPLGSTSYYFRDKNMLLREVFIYAQRRVNDHYARLETEVAAGRPWREALAAHVAWTTSLDLIALRRDYEMFLTGFEDPDLAQISRQWITLENLALKRLLPEELRQSVCLVLEGIYLAAAKTNRQFTSEEVLQILNKIRA